MTKRKHLKANNLKDSDLVVGLQQGPYIEVKRKMYWAEFQQFHDTSEDHSMFKHPKLPAKLEVAVY